MKARTGQEAAEKLAAVDELTTTAALLYFRMRKAAEEIVGEGAHSSGRRSILRDLLRNGSQTVPQMARFRGVSRQHIQQLVNVLVSDGLVEMIENPAHKRSRLVAATPKGVQLARDTARREAKLLPILVEDIDLEDLQTTTRVLRSLKSALDSKDWEQAVNREG
ncbi:MAG: MarR family transcriptional regulator [Acidobacteriota bacterium]|nr:MarR family transcriptional regulator [Acidobacteriota bacterium]